MFQKASLTKNIILFTLLISAASQNRGESITSESINWGIECVAPQGVSSDICLKYNNDFIISYPYNCNAYINCTMGCPFMDYCQDGKVFNNFLKICDTPDTEQCAQMQGVEKTVTGDNARGTTQEAFAANLQLSITSKESEILIGTIIPQYSENFLLTTDINSLNGECIPPLGVYPDVCFDKPQGLSMPYPYNCAAFMICDADCPYLAYCENGTIFNNNLGICDTPESTACEVLAFPTPATPSSTLSTANTGSTISTTPELPFSTTLPPGVNPHQCRNQPDFTAIPYAADCSHYLQCLKGEVRMHSCPNGWIFNYQLMLCDETSHDVCFTGEATTEKTGKAISFDKCIGQAPGTTFPYPENCSMYYFCGENAYALLNCPTNNYYDPLTGNCGPEDLVSPTACQSGIITTTESPTTTDQTTTYKPGSPSNGICGDYSNGELIVYPDNCQKYISCVRPIPIAFYCNDKWYFDLEEQICLPDTQCICSDIPSNTTTTIQPPSYICQGAKEGDWQIYPSDCSLYYECLGDGYFMLKMCTEGEYFDPLEGQCSSKVNAEYCKHNFDTTTPPPTTTEAPKPDEICKEKPDGSKISYPDNCFKYIVCSTPIPIGYNCPSGLQFSLEKQDCVEPVDSDCGLLPTPTTTTLSTPTMPYSQCTNKPDFTLLPYEADCSMFVICINDLEIFAYCNEGQYFDAVQGECVEGASEDACIVENSTTTIKTTTESFTTVESTTDTDEGSSITDASTTIEDETTSSEATMTSEITTTEASTTTTQDPNLGPCYGKPDGTKVAYPNNCTKYIQCQQPLPVGHYCPDGLEFSALYEECVSPELADCSMKTTTPQTTTENISSEFSTTENISTELPTTTTEMITTTTPNAKDTCDSKPTGSTLPYPADCSKYYICINGEAKLTKCMPNTYYDPVSGECYGDISATACQGTGTTTTIKETETEATTTEATTTFETTITPTTPPDSSKCCKNKPDNSTLPYPADCTKYYTCKNFKAKLTNCPANTFFDPSEGICSNNVSSIACQDPATTTEATTTEATTSPQDPEGPCYNQPNGYTYPYQTECSQYYICLKGSPYLSKCPHNSYYNFSSGKCDASTPSSGCNQTQTTTTPDSTTTTSEPQGDICCNQTYGTYLPYPGDSSKYVICQYPVPLVIQCPFGYQYDPFSKMCHTNDDVEIDPQTQCSLLNFGDVLAFNGDCTKYYLCFGDEAIVLNCDDNWYFSDDLKQCIPKESYRCPW